MPEETIAPELMDMLRSAKETLDVAQQAAGIAQVEFNGIRKFLSQRYNLGDVDSIDLATGLITRHNGNAEGEPS